MSPIAVWIILLIVPSTLAQTACRPPLLTSEPAPKVYFAEGGDAVLQCAARGSPEPTYTWKRNGRVIQPGKDLSKNINQMPTNGTLILSDLQLKDAAIFQCFAKNDFGTVASINVSLEAAVLHDFPALTQTHNPKLGESFTIPCHPPWSNPKGKVIWVIRDRQGGFRAAESAGRVVMDDNYSLQFVNVVSDDELDLPYTCMIANEFLKENTMGPIHYIRMAGDPVQNHPVSLLWASPRDLTAVEGTTITLQCIYGGNPTPTVAWQRLDNRARSSRVTINRHQLTITGVRPDDAGRYQCLAQNSLSTSRMSEIFNITVEAAPSFTRVPQNIQTGKGGMAPFHCEARGTPTPRISWIINGILLTNKTSKNQHIKRVSNNTIQVEQLQLDHSMVVQCNATNDHGSVVARAFLCVSPDAPEIITPPQSKVDVIVGNTVNLTCQTSSSTTHRVRWLKDGSQVQDSRYQVLESGDLVISSVKEEDAGIFRCEARNQLLMTSSREGKLVVCKEDGCPATSPDAGNVVMASFHVLHIVVFALAWIVC